MQRLHDFWSSVNADDRSLQGQPDGGAYEPRDPAGLFDRWLALWRDTTAELFAPAAAAQFRVKAERIAESLKLALLYRPGTMALRSAQADRG